MYKPQIHTFHIPVMGIGFTVDTPLKVARFGISSVVSIVEDNLLELLRKFYCEKEGVEFTPIETHDEDTRAKRVTAYLNLIDNIVRKQVEALKNESFDSGNEIIKYFRMLPEPSPIRKLFLAMLGADGEEKQRMQNILRESIIPGNIDVNIMTKIDKVNYDKNKQPMPMEHSDAMSALRGFALSNLESSVVFSAGLNPRVYGYCETFSDFFPDKNDVLKKKIIIKVSDYRSALIQGKFFAKKGLWVSEFRIESGLNCGGHAFATEGHLMGPILEEFKEKREALHSELLTLCNSALKTKEKNVFLDLPEMKITVQGGIGTAQEDHFLHEYYNVDSTGWGSPFLLVPEVTNVDAYTLNAMATAQPEDYYLSNASPMGVPFNNFRKSSGHELIKARIEKNRPGSPCYKKFLSTNVEFTPLPICTASREYQNQKIKELEKINLSGPEYTKAFNAIIEKDCLCEGLSSSALLVNEIPVPRNLDAVTICPGPNLAYFSGTFSMEQMIDHIYGRISLLNTQYRSHMFINELKLYVDYLNKEIEQGLAGINQKANKYLEGFKSNLITGIDYYKNLYSETIDENQEMLARLLNELNEFEKSVKNMVVPEPVVC